MDENEAALRAGTLDAVHVFQPYAERLLASGAGHLWYAAATRGLTAYTTLVTRRGMLERQQDELLKMTRAVHRTLRLVRAHAGGGDRERLRDYFPDVAPAIFAGAIERYRALGLWGSDPVIRREGYDRLHAAMRAAGTLSRDIAFEACVDTKLAEQAISLT